MIRNMNKSIEYNFRFLNKIGLRIENEILSNGKDSVKDTLDIYLNGCKDILSMYDRLNEKENTNVMVRLIGLDIIERVMNRYINNDNIKCKVYSKGDRVFMIFNYIGNSRDYLYSIDRLKFLDIGSKFGSNMKYSKKRSNKVASISIKKDNDIFKKWIYNKVLGYMKSLYPDRVFELVFTMD